MTYSGRRYPSLEAERRIRERDADRTQWFGAGNAQ